MSRETLAAARAFLKKKLQPVSVAPRGKAAIGNWATESVTAKNVDQHFSGRQNIALRLGAASHGLTDVDLDSHEAVILGNDFLPPTGMVSGRTSKPSSHWFYVSTLYESEESASIQYRDVDGTMICELRTGGGAAAAITVVPPSEHESGEQIKWYKDGEPAKIEGDDLKCVVAKTAAAALLARYWPAEGGRHIAALTLDGFLSRLGWSKKERQHFIGQVSAAAGD